MVFIQIIIVFYFSNVKVSFGASKDKISLSPALWSREDFQRLETISLRKNPRPKPLAFSDVDGLVAGTTSALAVHAGTDALRKGGNAMDACLATAMAEIPLTAGAKVSFAGVANILYYEHLTGKVHNLDAGWRIPRFRDQEVVPSLETLGDSVLVPGLLAGMFEAAEFSKFPLSTLLEPALFFAEQGFKMPHSLSKMIKQYYNKYTLLRTDKGSKIFTNSQTKKPYEPTELFRQPQLAKFIRNVQKSGKNYFYRGKWTKKMTASVRAHGGDMTVNDMADYEAQWIEPVSTTYNGYHVTTTGSDWGGVELIEMLKLMDLAKLSKSNDTYLTNATKLLSLISISRYSQFISAYSHANPEAWGTLNEYFYIDASRKGRMSNESAKEIWDHLSNQEGLDLVYELITELLTSIPDVDRHRENRRGSSGVVAIDKEGNVCSMAHTANSRPWGTGLFVQGVALPHSGAVLRDFVERGQPGSAVPSGLQPVLIFKKDIEKKESAHLFSDGIVVQRKNRRRGQKRFQKNRLPQRLNLKNLRAETTLNSTETHSKNLLSEILMSKKRGLKGINFIKGQHSEQRGGKELLGSGNETDKVGANPSIGFETIKRQQINETEKRQNYKADEEFNEERNDSKVIDLEKIQWESEWENELGNKEENELENNEGDGSESDLEYNEWEENEWENEWENESEREPFESEEEKNGNTDTNDFEDPQTIGGLFDENDINSDLGRNDNNKTTNTDTSPIKYKVKSWFRDFVRELLQREKKRFNSSQIKDYKKKRRNRPQFQPVAALSVIGQSSTEALLQYINNLLDNGMDAKQASDAPMFYSSTPGSLRQDVRLERFSFDPRVISDVRSRGQNVSEVIYKVGRVLAGFGAVLMVKDSKAYGCSHPDSEGYAEGH